MMLVLIALLCAFCLCLGLLGWAATMLWRE